MNKNKGIIGLGLILAIVLGIIVVGGGSYYLGNKNKDKGDNITPSQYYSTEEYKINNPQANCKPNSPSAIKLISPNGGEIYKAGDKITVKWESCNVDKNSIGISLIKHGPSSIYFQREWTDDYAGFDIGGVDPYKGIVDDGTHEITLPLSTDPNLILGQHYFISISGTGDVTNIGSGHSPRDYSDNLFTINSPKVVKTDPFDRYVSLECKTFNGCNGPIDCVDKSFDSNGMSSTCEYLPEYACYKINSIKCEKQITGKCGWTNSPEFNSCIDKARSSQ